LDYYHILGVRPTATTAEIKSAYRRLARERHPDVNGGSEQAARAFAELALAYRILSDAQERAYYDARRERQNERGFSPQRRSTAGTGRARRVRAQVRTNSVIENLRAQDRRETLMLQRAVYPIVALFLSALFAPVLRPYFWQSFGPLGRTTMATLALIGLWHLVTRLKSWIERYSYRADPALDQFEQREIALEKPFTRQAAYAFITLGPLASFILGIYLGEHTQYNPILMAMPLFFDPKLHPELLLYPPIIVLIVDTLHTLALKMDL
jgi:curved DNA-binding protein CbpA